MRSKSYQECRFDVKKGEEFKVLKKIGEKGRAFRVGNERGQLGHLQYELVCEPCRGLKSVLFHESNTSSCHHFAIAS